jgi:hypothetical protein
MGNPAAGGGGGTTQVARTWGWSAAEKNGEVDSDAVDQGGVSGRWSGRGFGITLEEYKG